MTAGAYITTECGRAKLELGDDPQKTGVYNLNFTVVNMTDADKTYTVDASVQTESAETGRINADGTRRYLMTQTPHMLNSEIAGNGAITVPAGGSTEVSVTITLTEEDIAYIEKYFPNGIYVEGFVTLTAGEENGVDLSAPFLAFYGDWLALPAIEQSSYYDFTEIETGECDATHVVNGVYTYDANYDEYIGLGTSMAWPNNSVYPTEELGTMRYVANRNAISPNGDSIRDAIDAIAIGLNRNVENFYYSVANAETGVEYYRKDLGFVPKTYYNDNAGQALYVGAYDNEEFDWDYTDLEGNPCPTTQNLLLHFVRNWLIMAGSAPKSGRCRSRLTPKAQSRMFPWSAMNGNMKNGAMRKTTMSARVNTTTFPLSSLTTARISTWTGTAAGLHMLAVPAQARFSTIPLNPVP